MRSFSVILVAVAATLTATPAAGAATLTAAQAAPATLTTDTSCYQETTDVVLTGRGFKPSSTVAISQDGVAIGSTPTDAQGGFTRKFATAELRLPTKEKVYDLAATDGAATAVTRYRVSKVFADFTPGTGNPATLRVRFSVNGFGLLKRNPTVYVHYVRPNGKVRRTVRLGRARGTCGKIERTARRRLFGFRAERGRWILQFDTNRTYRKATQRSTFVWVRKPVEVFARRA
jgi:hypothetical protein